MALRNTYVRDGDGVENLLRVQVPQTQSVRLPDAETWVQNAHRFDKVRGEDVLPLPVDAQAVGVELILENVQRTRHRLGPFVDDVEVGIRLNQATGRGADGGAHVRDVEATVGLCADLIGDGGEDTPIALLERGAVGVGRVEVEGRVLL